MQVSMVHYVFASLHLSLPVHMSVSIVAWRALLYKHVYHLVRAESGKYSGVVLHLLTMCCTSNLYIMLMPSLLCWMYGL